MKIEFLGEKHKTLLFIDIEYDREHLKQIGCLLFNKQRHSLYELVGSFNFYIKDKNKVDPFFTYITGISGDFLNQYGCPIQEVKENFKTFLENRKDILVIGHGVHDDLNILFKNGIDITKYDQYCTLTNAKQLWPNNQKYNVGALSAEQYFYLDGAHDAYHDVWGLVPIFAALKEGEKVNENNSNKF